MPTYEYLCKTCSNRFETWQKMTDEPLTTCPECGNTIRRVLYPAGVVFKGSGFYKTDSVAKNNDEKKPAEAATSETKAEGESKSENKSSENATGSTTTSESNKSADTGTKVA